MAEPRTPLSALVDLPLAAPPPMPELERRARRLRLRRRAGAATGGVCLAAAVVAAAVTVVPGDHGQTVRAGAPGGVAGAGPDAWASPHTLKEFSVDGQRWQFVVSNFGPGDLCLRLHGVASGSVENAGCWNGPYSSVMGVITQHAGFDFVAGVLPADTAALELRAGGTTGTAPVLGADAAFPARFFGEVVAGGTSTVDVVAGTAAEPRKYGAAVHPPATPPDSTPAPTTAPAPTAPAPTTLPAPGLVPATTVVRPAPTTTVPPDAPVGTVVPPTSVAPPGAGQPARVEVVPGATGLRKQRFESASASEGSSVAVRFWGGPAPCDVLGRVDVVEAADRVTITLWSGTTAMGENQACVAIAVYKEALVTLAAPLGSRTVVDGAA